MPHQPLSQLEEPLCIGRVLRYSPLASFLSALRILYSLSIASVDSPWDTVPVSATPRHWRQSRRRIAAMHWPLPTHQRKPLSPSDTRQTRTTPGNCVVACSTKTPKLARDTTAHERRLDPTDSSRTYQGGVRSCVHIISALHRGHQSFEHDNTIVPGFRSAQG